MNETTAARLGPSASIASKLNWLRAGVLGANDGIVSTSSIIFGVAGASASRSTVVLAGIAAIAAGAMSMAAGEYVSVSSQRDLEDAELERERREIEANPECELVELQHMLEERGIDRSLARRVALQLTARDPLTAHARLEFGIDPSTVVNPWQATIASMLAFTAGGLIPLLSMILAPRAVEIWISGAAVLIALTLTGWISAALGGASRPRSVARNVLGGLLAMAITYGVGKIVGATL
ncbi:MAG TPA: VIT family protein [Sphingomicrobium sp.]|jgi:VIT1/CCC1 family predicted Fe2+/Mn2+ transporter|nr:VIT family protein [Sphingomicrobium sp.]